MIDARPAPDDIVIRRDTVEGETVFVLRRALTVDQFLVRSYLEAVNQALAFAREHGVRVWMTDGDHRFSLITSSEIESV